MEVIEKRLEEIKPYENNPRHNDAAVPYVANSIREFGFKVPLVIDSGGTIVAGHTRYKAAQRLGLETVPCVVADDLTDEQVKAFRIADNKVAEVATWDEEALSVELSEIEIADIDMGDFGILDLPEDDEIVDIDSDNVGGSETSLHKITLDGTSWNIAEDEAELFRERMLDWIDDNGLSFGFLRSIL